MYVDFSGRKYRESELSLQLLQNDVDRYSSLTQRMVSECETDSSDIYAQCTYRAARKLCQFRRNLREKNSARRERDQVRRDCGLIRVRGALGGVYWE